MTIDDLRAAWPGVVFEPGEHGWVFAHANRDRCSFAGNMPSELDQHIRELRDALTVGQRTAEQERADVVAYLDAEEARMRAMSDTYGDEGARSRVQIRASEVANQASHIRARAHVGASEEP